MAFLRLFESALFFIENFKQIDLFLCYKKGASGLFIKKKNQRMTVMPEYRDILKTITVLPINKYLKQVVNVCCW